MKSVKYIGFYNAAELKYKRVGALSATQKMDYIVTAFNDLDCKVKLYSPSWVEGKGLSKSKKIHKDENILYFPPSLGSNKKLICYLSIIVSVFWLLYVLIKHCKRGEKIIAYHSPWLSIPLLIAMRLKNIKIILEVEEIYQDVYTFSKTLNYFENKIIKNSHAYILSTELLRTKIPKNKDYIILYGNYTEFPKLTSPKDDGMIHLLYAGIIDEEKAGAFNALEATRFLDSRYVLHILGFGNIDLLQRKIKEMEKFTDCKSHYEGIKTGDDFIRFSQTCHIGLSTQTAEGQYNDTSFPSKILTYLGLGLQVISCDIKVVRNAEISSAVKFYHKTPKDLADAIKNINSTELVNKYNQDFLNNLDNQFKKGLSKLMSV